MEGSAKTTVDGEKVPPRSTQQFHFVDAAQPHGASRVNKKISKTKARSFLARQAHSKVRHARVVQHQEATHGQSFARGTREESQHTRYNATHSFSTQEDSSDASYQAGPTASTCFISPNAPGPSSLLDSRHGDPFHSTSVYCSSFEDFLLHHYISFVLPNAQTFYPNMVAGSWFHHSARDILVPFSFTKPVLMSGLFLTACRSLALLYQQDNFDYHALRYRNDCLRAVTHDIGEGLSDTTVISALHLGIDEFHSGNIHALQSHNLGLAQMIKVLGGLPKLGLRGMLAQLILWHDRMSTFYSGANPNFMHMSEFQDAVPTTGLVNGFSKYMDESLFSADMMSILTDVGKLNAEIQVHPQHDEQISHSYMNNLDVQLLKLSSDHRCPSSCRSYTETEICLSLTLMVYLGVTGRTHPSVSRVGNAYLVARMWQSLHRLSQQPAWLAHADLSLWMVLTVRLAMDSLESEQRADPGWRTSLSNPNPTGRTDDTFLALMRKEQPRRKIATLFEALDITSSCQLISCMRTFLWKDDCCTAVAYKLWSTFESGRAE